MRLFLIFLIFQFYLFAEIKLEDNYWYQRYESFKEYKKIQEDLKTESNISNKETLKKKIDIFDFKNGLVPNDFFDENLTKKEPKNFIASFIYFKELKDKENYYENQINNFYLFLKNKKIEHSDKIILEQEYNNLNMSWRIYHQKLNENLIKIENDLKEIGLKIFISFFIIFCIFLVFFSFKYILKKIIKDYYSINKIINISFFFIFLIGFLIFYIDNLAILITTIGVASLSIAIFFKEPLNNFFAWFSITISGSLKVGQRISITYNLEKITGEIIDISFSKISLYETMNSNNVKENLTSGKIIYIPNQIVYNTIIKNMSFHNFNIIWDNIYFVLNQKENFDEIIKDIENIIKNEIGIKESYNLRLNQIAEIKHDFNLKIKNESFTSFLNFEENGIKINIYYPSPSKSALKIKTNLSKKILKYFNEKNIILIFKNI